MDVSPKVYRSPIRGVVDTLGSITKKKKKITPIQIYWKFYHQKMKIFR